MKFYSPENNTRGTTSNLTTKVKKQQNHRYSEKSKFSGRKEPIAANARKGDRVHIKSEGSKHELRDVYVVLETNGENVSIVKLMLMIQIKLRS